jgi:GT2 family glycosyltransferase
MDLSIIIVSYNTSDLIGTCLSSVTAADDVSKEVFVVDNASTDGSADLIRKNFPSVGLIANYNNRRFAAANNQVLPQCSRNSDDVVEKIRFLLPNPEKADKIRRKGYERARREHS